MPLYAYICAACQHKFEELHSMADNNVPCGLPCPACKKKKKVQRDWGESRNAIGIDTMLTASKVTGGQFREVIERIKNSGQVPKRFHDKLDNSVKMSGGHIKRG